MGQRRRKEMHHQIYAVALARRWKGTTGSWFRVDNAIFSSNFFSFDVCFSFAHMCAKRNGVRSSNDLISYCRISRNRFTAILMLTHQFDFCSFFLQSFAFYRLFPSFIIVFLFYLICLSVCVCVFLSTFSSSTFQQFKQFKITNKHLHFATTEG